MKSVSRMPQWSIKRLGQDDGIWVGVQYFKQEGCKEHVKG